MPRGRPKTAGAGSTRKAAKAATNGANLGFEAQLFLAADKLRKNLEPSDYKHVVLGLILLNHITNTITTKQALAHDLTHSHPNGQKRPGEQAQSLTRTMMLGAETARPKVADHLIVSPKESYGISNACLH